MKKNDQLKVGDLVQHLTNKRYGIVITGTKLWRSSMAGIPFCKVAWLDYDRYNLMDARMLIRISTNKLEEK